MIAYSMDDGWVKVATTDSAAYGMVGEGRDGQAALEDLGYMAEQLMVDMKSEIRALELKMKVMGRLKAELAVVLGNE